jgi:hypothetical protein
MLKIKALLLLLVVSGIITTNLKRSMFIRDNDKDNEDNDDNDENYDDDNVRDNLDQDDNHNQVRGHSEDDREDRDDDNKGINRFNELINELYENKKHCIFYRQDQNLTAQILHKKCYLQGPIGDQGLVGPVGPQGLAGPQGIQGLDGLPGLQGPDGVVGEIGLQGPQGLDGLVGPAGPQGPAGQPTGAGPEGIPGEQGPQGPQGPLGNAGPVGNDCVCVEPILYTKLSDRKSEWCHESFELKIIDHKLDIENVPAGRIMCWANGGYNLPCKCKAEFELNFYYRNGADLAENFYSFTGVADPNCGLTVGSAYTAAKDNDLWIPVGFSQYTQLVKNNNFIYLYGKGTRKTKFVALGVQCALFPDY